MRKAFTITELVVCIVIIAILVSLAASAVVNVRQSVLVVQCANNLRQIGIGLHEYADAYHKFPPVGRADNAGNWLTSILPYVGETAIYNQLLYDQAIDAETGIDTYHKNRVHNLFVCPAVGNDGTVYTSYVAYMGKSQDEDGDCQFDRPWLDVNAKIVGDRPPSPPIGLWTGGREHVGLFCDNGEFLRECFGVVPENATRFWSFHRRHFLMSDGSVY